MESLTANLQDPGVAPLNVELTTTQETCSSHVGLITAVRELVKQIKEVNVAPYIEKLELEGRNEDPVTKALQEERSEGRLKTVPQWEQIGLRRPLTVEQENKAHLKKYEDFWERDESNGLETQAVDGVYNSAFGRFDDIYRSLGWHPQPKLIFDAALLSQHQNELVESVFAVEAYRMQNFGRLRALSRASFEYSRLPRLLLILVRIQSRQNQSLQCCSPTDDSRFDAQTLLKVLSEVARSLRSTSWTDGRNEMTLKGLLRRCYTSNLILQPGPEDVDQYWQHFRLLIDCLSALDFTHNFPDTRDPLSRLFFFKFQQEPIYKIMEMITTSRRRRLITGINAFKQLHLPESTKQTFFPDQFNMQYLQNFGGLKIEWTNSLEEHLKIYTGRNALRVFAHPTYFDNYVDLNCQNRDYHEPTFVELSLTYALLFRPSSQHSLLSLLKHDLPSAFSNTILRRNFTFTGNHQDYPFRSAENPTTKKLIIDPGQLPARPFLQTFFRCSLPPCIQAAFNIAGGSTQIQSIGAYNEIKVTPKSMKNIFELAPRYPEDIQIMMLAVFEQNFEDFESFQTFPYFGPRLRQLQTYMDNRQPRTVLELWSDRRDYRSWAIFWAFMSLYSLSLLFLVGFLSRKMYNVIFLKL